MTLQIIFVQALNLLRGISDIYISFNQWAQVLYNEESRTGDFTKQGRVWEIIEEGKGREAKNHFRMKLDNLYCICSLKFCWDANYYLSSSWKKISSIGNLCRPWLRYGSISKTLFWCFFVPKLGNIWSNMIMRSYY